MRTIVSALKQFVTYEGVHIHMYDGLGKIPCSFNLDHLNQLRPIIHAQSSQLQLPAAPEARSSSGRHAKMSQGILSTHLRLKPSDLGIELLILANLIVVESD